MTGYAFCGSFCTLSRSIEVLEVLVKSGLDILPIVSENVFSTDTRFWQAKEFCAKVEELCQKEIVHTIKHAEPLGPKLPLDALVVAPCTGNTLAKAANGITDTAVTMAMKAHLRSDRPLVIALASNDALSSNLKNIGIMLSRKSVYFVPMEQDDPQNKPHSLVADFSQIPITLERAMQGRQHQKLFV